MLIPGTTPTETVPSMEVAELPTILPTADESTPPVPDEQPTGPSQISIAWVGDMTFGHYHGSPPAGVASLFDGVRDELKSDLTIGNLETVIGTMPPSKCGADSQSCFEFVAPPETAQALSDAGFVVVNTANNHSRDAGAPGVASTEAALTDANVTWTGQPDQISYVLDVTDGISIAVLGFAPYASVSNALDLDNARQLVEEASHNADLVVVVIHLGAEGGDKQHVTPGSEYAFGENRGDPMAFSHMVIDAGADLVIGSGPHVLRGMQWYNGHLIAYSLGNFIGYNSLSVSGPMGLSGILHVTLDSDGQFVDGRLTPIILKAPGLPTIDPQGRSITMINQLSQTDFGSSAAVTISADGQIAPPL